METFTFKKLEHFNKKDLAGINRLLEQWSDKGYQMSPHYFKKLIKKSHVLAVLEKEVIIGTVTLIEIHKLSGSKGFLEHLIVDTAHRGKGLGKGLMKYAIATAKNLGMGTLFLTCEPHRTTANALYQKLGFTPKDTAFYQLHLR